MTRFLLFLVLVFTWTLSSTASEWPRFRGPNGNGTSDAISFNWSKTENLLWQVDVPGKGNGSPIVVNGKVYLQTASADGSQRMLLCFDAATGQKEWSTQMQGAKSKTHIKSSLASNTPAFDGERIFCCVWDGNAVAVHAFDLKGKEVWSNSLGSFVSQHGAGMSPVVHQGKVFVNFDQDGKAEALALDAKTGAKIWSDTRKPYRACYSTPLVRELPGGKTEVVFLSTAAVTAYDPETGHKNWEWMLPWKEGEAGLRSVASPLLASDVIVAVTGDGSGARYCAGVTPGATKPKWEYRSKQAAPYVPCPVTKGDHIYWVTDQGIIQCVAIETGKVVWEERAFNAAVSASPILVGDTLVAIDEKGKVVACKAQPSGYDKVMSADLGEAVFASPAAADGRIYIRTASKLYCFGKKS